MLQALGLAALHQRPGIHHEQENTIDSQQEGNHGDELGLKEIADRYKVGRSTITGWINKGVRIRGRLVVLQAYRVGNQWRVTWEALEQFIRDCNP